MNVFQVVWVYFSLIAETGEVSFVAFLNYKKETASVLYCTEHSHLLCASYRKSASAARFLGEQSYAIAFEHTG